MTALGELVIFNSTGKELAAVRDLLNKKQQDEGWKIRGLEICPDQTFVSVMTCRVVPGKNGPEKEYDRFIFLKIERDSSGATVDRIFKLFSVKMS